MTDERKAIVALNTIPGFRAILFHRARKRFGSARAVLRAGEDALLSLTGLGPATAAALSRLDLEGAWGRELAGAERLGADIVTVLDEEYPTLLREIHDPPPVLYRLGRFRAADADAVALVGSRAATEYGRVTAGRLARDLAAAGITVVSGLARGIDSCAHRGALEGGGRTIAVLGGGLDRLYPPENRRLAERIARSGAVITEFPFGAGPEKWHFPMRNRTISGMSRGVVVVEAARKSGALITADLALEAGREVFAVPGNVSSPTSSGPNRLIRDGAKLVTEGADILEEFPEFEGRLTLRPEGTPGLSDEERTLLAGMGQEPVAVDELIRSTRFSTSRTVALLTALEIKGLVRQLAGRRFVTH